MTGFRRHAEPEWLVAIPAIGLSARYHWPAKGGGHRAVYTQVIAWSDTGEPLVLDPKRRMLARATDDPTFVKIVRTATVVHARRGAGAQDDAPEDIEGAE